jgi:hypothetical protein
MIFPEEKLPEGLYFQRKSSQRDDIFPEENPQRDDIAGRSNQLSYRAMC